MHGIHEGNITIGCDGQSAIDASSSDYKVIHTNRKHFDLIMAISIAIKGSPLSWRFTHVKAHQDEVLPFNELSFFLRSSMSTQIIMLNNI